MTTDSLSSPTGFALGMWRRLRTMRTAIILLLLLGAGASVGSLFPQRPIDPSAVRAWIDRNEGWAPIAERLGLFDVYGAWWFMAIYALLLVSLVGCLVPRYRAFVRQLRAQPKPAAALPTQQRYHAGVVALPADEALAGAERVLRARRYRVARHGSTVAAERGHIREGGSLVFHTAFLVLLLGVSLGKWYGFSGQIARVEGEGFTDTHVEYDSITEGRFYGERHTGYSLEVEDFDVAWFPNGTPKHFISTVRLFDAGGRFVRTEKIRVNHPIEHEGVKIYQAAWGWAPRIQVRQNGELLYDQPTIFLSRDGRWRGVAKIPQTTPKQTGLEMYFFTDPELAPNGVPFDRSPQPRNPVVIVQPYRGDLNLRYAQNVFALDPENLEPEGSVQVLRQGQTIRLPDGIVVSFTDLEQYTVLQIAANPGAPVLAGAALMILIGLVPALYGSRRRAWVRAEPLADGGARIEIAGHALQRKAAFEEEFRALVRAIDQELAAVGSSRPRQPDTIGAKDG